MINMPGRDGAVTGGTFDQSNRRLLPSLSVAGVGACDAAGATGVLLAGAGSAAETWSVRLSTPARPDFTNDTSVRCAGLEKELGFLAGVNEAGRQSGRHIADFRDFGKKCPPL